MFRSTDAAATWTSISAGLPNPFVFALRLDASHPAVLYAGTSGNSVVRWDSLPVMGPVNRVAPPPPPRAVSPRMP